MSDSDATNPQSLIVPTINVDADDLLANRSQTLAFGDRIAVTGSNLSFNDGAFASFAGGTGSTPLVISFNSGISRNAITALLPSVEFSTSLGSPIGVRFISFELTDDTRNGSGRIAQQVAVDDTNPLTDPLTNPLL